MRLICPSHHTETPPSAPPPPLHRGGGGLGSSLNQRSLLDAMQSLEALQPAYYGPSAFLGTAGGGAFLTAALRLSTLLLTLGRSKTPGQLLCL